MLLPFTNPGRPAGMAPPTQPKVGQNMIRLVLPLGEFTSILFPNAVLNAASCPGLPSVCQLGCAALPGGKWHPVQSEATPKDGAPPFPRIALMLLLKVTADVKLTVWVTDAVPGKLFVTVSVTSQLPALLAKSAVTGPAAGVEQPAVFAPEMLQAKFSGACPVALPLSCMPVVPPLISVWVAFAVLLLIVNLIVFDPGKVNAAPPTV